MLNHICTPMISVFMSSSLADLQSMFNVCDQYASEFLIFYFVDFNFGKIDYKFGKVDYKLGKNRL